MIHRSVYIALSGPWQGKTRPLFCENHPLFKPLTNYIMQAHDRKLLLEFLTDRGERFKLSRRLKNTHDILRYKNCDNVDKKRRHKRGDDFLR